MRSIILISIVTLIISSCSRSKYLTADYDKLANQHSTIAVMPYDIQLKGRLVAKMSEAEITDIRITESKLFQQSLYSEILERTGRRNKDINISVQDLNKSNRLLKDAGIDPANISEFSPKELGDILNVDAIISTRLIKEMFMTREEALLANVATEVAGDLLGKNLPTAILSANNAKMTRSSEIDMYCSIVDTELESAIWIYNTDCDIQWDTDPDDAVEFVNRKISRRFPYRK